MSFKVHQSTIRTIRPGDPLFKLKDGIVMGQRAGFEIKQECPREYKLVLQDCIDRGWIVPVACMHDYEMTFAVLKD